ncbi:MAG: Gfo/Idh/MocA family oxidoreductase [Armatimonadetes bacterium]|nr:Gfo/Idh/MocA family oxidoreductase [Armatimonadota bacterium]
MSKKTLKGAVVGCRMGAAHAKAMAQLPDYEVVAVCDIDEEKAQEVAYELGTAKPFTSYAEMLREMEIDVVAIATPTAIHAEQTFMAIDAGVKGICCEKPMATNLADARKMVSLCQERGIALIVNHQRRMGKEMVAARNLIEQGAIGEVRLIRVHCAGDFLSDGTHAVDSALWLLGDPEIDWVLGQVELPEKPRQRYGHLVENSAIALFQTVNGVRVEIFCGEARERYRAYQDYEIIGTKGRIWRTGDQPHPNLFIQDSKGGSWDPQVVNGILRPVPSNEGLWRPVEVEPDDAIEAMKRSYALLAKMVRDGIDKVDHPLSAEKALHGFEIVMAVYESARLHKRVHLPLQQDKFPLELMVAKLGW